MYRNNFYPLRTIVGDPPIPIKSIEQFSMPGAPVGVGLEIISFPDQLLADTVHMRLPGGVESIYDFFLPNITNGNVDYRPANGMATMPLPIRSDLPFTDGVFSEADMRVGSVFGFPKKANVREYDILLGSDNPIQDQPFVSNTDREISFLITLAEEALIGGICFNGYPYITSRPEHGTGMTLGNFGLPREIRLTPLSPIGSELEKYSGFERSQFIDSEFAYTREEIISHSGLNYLCIDPVKTNRFLLTLTDLPFIITSIDLDKSTADTLHVAGYKGFAIPYLWFFKYNESTHKNARLHSGILGVTSEAKPVDDNGNTDLLRVAFPEYAFCRFTNSANNAGEYALYTAHSTTGQRRSFALGLPNLYRKGKTDDEIFISEVLRTGEKVTLYLEQGEEYERCIAGLKMLLLFVPDDIDSETLIGTVFSRIPDRTVAEQFIDVLMGIPEDVIFCDRVQIRIFEIDPIEGVSPVSVDLNKKYATLLVKKEITNLFEELLDYLTKGIAFKRSSTARYFAIELTNTGKEEGQIVIHSMNLVRSAHVSVQPRAAKTQQVKALHYRIIGPELADDFSKLGTEGFNFSIDRVVAGQTQNVLYSAMSLLDLLHTGNAKIQSNIRRRAVEFEMIQNYRDQPSSEYAIKKLPGDDFTGTNFEDRETDNTNTSWRSIESGKDPVWPLAKGTPDFVGFESYSGSENRSRIEHISSLADEFFTQLDTLRTTYSDFSSLLDTIFPLSALVNFETASNRIFNDSSNTSLWTPFINGFGFTVVNPPPSISGIQTLNIPPFFFEYYDMITSLLQMVNNPISNADLLVSLLTGDPLSLLGQSLSSTGFNFLINSTNIADNAISKFTLVNGLSLGFNLGGNVGAMGGPVVGYGKGGYTGGFSFGFNSNLASSLQTSTNGSTGNIVLSGQELKYSLNRSMQEGYDNTITHSEMNASEQKRIVTRRELLKRDEERVRGAEVMWQGKIQDIITGSIPVNFTLPATATKMNFRTADDSLRIRFNSGFSPSIEVDFWFELTEEIIRDDY